MLRGRRDECARLDRLLEEARAGRSGALVLVGEAGMGKTALLDYAIASASDLRVLRSVGVEAEMELAFAALHQLCGPVLDRVDRLPEPQRDALLTTLGLRAGPAPDRFLVGLAVLSLLLREQLAARSSPAARSSTIAEADREVRGIFWRSAYVTAVDGSKVGGELVLRAGFSPQARMPPTTCFTSRGARRGLLVLTAGPAPLLSGISPPARWPRPNLVERTRFLPSSLRAVSIEGPEGVKTMPEAGHDRAPCRRGKLARGLGPRRVSAARLAASWMRDETGSAPGHRA